MIGRERGLFATQSKLDLFLHNFNENYFQKLSLRNYLGRFKMLCIFVLPFLYLDTNDCRVNMAVAMIWLLSPLILSSCPRDCRVNMAVEPGIQNGCVNMVVDSK